MVVVVRAVRISQTARDRLATQPIVSIFTIKSSKVCHSFKSFQEWEIGPRPFSEFRGKSGFLDRAEPGGEASDQAIHSHP